MLLFDLTPIKVKKRMLFNKTRQYNIKNVNKIIFFKIYCIVLSYQILFSFNLVCFLRGKCLLMVRWVIGSILHGVDSLSYFSFQPVLHDWCNKGRGMYYPVCGMMHIKKPLLLIGKNSLCAGSWFPLLLSEWSFTICLMPYEWMNEWMFNDNPARTPYLNKIFPSFCLFQLYNASSLTITLTLTLF